MNWPHGATAVPPPSTLHADGQEKRLDSVERDRSAGGDSLAGGERQIKHTDSEIDRLVYELYGLTEEEIAIVEGATA